MLEAFVFLRKIHRKTVPKCNKRKTKFRVNWSETGFKLFRCLRHDHSRSTDWTFFSAREKSRQAVEMRYVTAEALRKLICRESTAKLRPCVGIRTTCFRHFSRFSEGFVPTLNFHYSSLSAFTLFVKFFAYGFFLSSARAFCLRFMNSNVNDVIRMLIIRETVCSLIFLQNFAHI